MMLINVFIPNKAMANVNPTMIENAITVDGVLDEAQWANTPAIEDFKVVTPDTGAAPTHKTQTKILYSDEGIYFAISNFQPADTQVERLTSRDNFVERDNVRLVLDTSGKGLYGYVFTVGLGGSLIDGTVQPERQFAYEWNAPWQAQTKRYDDRWDAEMFIPWSALKLPTATDKRTIGLSIERHISYLAEDWAVPALGSNRSVFLSALLPVEFNVLETKSELTFVPYFSSSMDRLNKQNDQSFGFDVYYQPTSDSQLSLTVSPDFGQVENDDIVVNFSAFETYAPEKRAFFLEGQEIFKPKGAMMVNTRRIGARPDAPVLNDDQSVEESVGFSDVIAAGKYTGQVGDVRFGVLSAVEDDTNYNLNDGSQTTVDGRKFMALRSVYETITDNDDYQAFGYMGTLVDSQSNNASTHMIDGEFRSADNTLQIDSQLYFSDTGESQGYGQFASVLYTPEQGYEHGFEFKHIDRNLDLNDMGFLPRNNLNVFHYYHGVPEATESEHYKSMKIGQWFDYRTNNDGERINARIGNWLNIQFDDLTRFNLTAHYTASGWNDRNSRGNGSYRTDAILTVWSRWKSDQSQAFSYGMAGWVKNAQIKGKIFNVRPFITYTPTDNISIDAEVMYRKTDNWQIWQEDNRI
ncbi:MAG: DUF5916 domain-containing protein, partial [Psychrosphaera sp.]|nr:DUF5916 domain-containing protein [Psychrosphaera sp.]